MGQDELTNSIRDTGFLSPFATDLVQLHRISQSEWFTLADELNQLGQRQVQRGTPRAMDVSSNGPSQYRSPPTHPYNVKFSGKHHSDRARNGGRGTNARPKLL
jgi:hypothetical protein